MFSSEDKIYLQTSDIPTLKNKINNAIGLSNQLASVLNDLECYNIEFKIEAKNILQ